MGVKNYNKCNFIKVLAPLCRSLPYLLTQTKLRRTKQPHKHQNRSKYVTRPDKVTNLGNHNVWSTNKGKTLTVIYQYY